MRLNYTRSGITRTVLLVLVVLALASAAHAQARMATPGQTVELVISQGTSYLMPCGSLTKVAVGDAAVADVYPVSTKELLVNAKGIGSTNLYVWDRSVAGGLAAYRVRVVASQTDLAAMAVKINSDMGPCGITARPVGDSILLEGEVTDQLVSQKAEMIAMSYSKNVKNTVRVGPSAASCDAVAGALTQALDADGLTAKALPDGTVAVKGKVSSKEDMDRIARLVDQFSGCNKGTKIINLVTESPLPMRQIMIRSQVLELDRSKAKDLGLEWGRASTAATTPTVINQPFLIGQDGPGPLDLFGGGPLRRLDPLGARISALIDDNKIRVLSEPHILVADGNQASILVGGEIPIPVVQGSGTTGSTSVTIQYREFGVRLGILPKIGENDTIQLHVTPEVSDIAEDFSVAIGGIFIPGLRSRKAETTVQVVNGQSLMIGGLFSSKDTKIVRRIPLLSKIPVIGEFFKRTDTQKTDTELVILITPEIVEPGSKPSAQAKAMTPEKLTEEYNKDQKSDK